MSLQWSRNATKNSQTSPLILLRAYNEAPIIKNTLKHLYTAGYKNILLVDDGSTDGTSQILSEFSQKHPEASLVKHAQNRGAGAALETGFEYIRRNILDAPYVITFDADGQHQVEDIEKIIQKFENYSEVDVIFWSRFLEGDTSKNIPTLRKYILKSGTIFTKLFSWIALTDAHNWLRGFRTSVLNNLRLQTDSMAYATELTELIAKQNISYAEVPVEILYTQYSLDKGQRSSNAIFIGLYAVWSKFFK